MADNVELSSGSGGATIATDDDGTAQHQYVKVEFGADNTQTKVTSTTGLPVQLLAGTAAVGKLAANTGVDIGDVDILSIAAGDNNIGNVDIVTVPAPLSTTGGGTEATAQRVTIANDSTGVVSVDDNGGSLTVDGTITELNSTAILADTASMDTNLGTVAGAVAGTEMQVDVVAALPAGTNAIGKLAANSGVDIGDVDATSVIPGTGATNLGKAIDNAAGATDTGVAMLAKHVSDAKHLATAEDD